MQYFSWGLRGEVTSPHRLRGERYAELWLIPGKAG